MSQSLGHLETNQGRVLETTLAMVSHNHASNMHEAVIFYAQYGGGNFEKRHVSVFMLYHEIIFVCTAYEFANFLNIL